MTNTFARSFPLEDIVIRAGGDGRTVEAYAAVFDTPAEIRDKHGHYNEVIGRTAFTKTLVERAGKVGVFYHHGMTLHGTPSDLGSVPIGTPLEIRAEQRGLLTVTRYNRSALADAVLESIRNGDITGQSFNGRAIQSSPAGRVPRARPGQPLPTVTRTEIALTEYGPTPNPAYETASILTVRSAEHIVNDIAGLDEAERAELIRMLSATPVTEPATDPATPATGAGAEEPQQHSGRLAIARARLRMEMISKGVLIPNG
jgi:HK97 family phage prohead protease